MAPIILYLFTQTHTCTCVLKHLTSHAIVREALAELIHHNKEDADRVATALCLLIFIINQIKQ